MALADKKVLMVMPPNRFNEDEFEITRKVLENRGLRVTIASVGLGELRGQKRATARATVKLDDVKTYDYDAIVFVGGEGARSLVDHEKATKLAKDAEYKVLGAIGVAPAILAKGGVLKGKRATAAVDVAGILRSQEAVYTAQPLEVADKIVTAQDAKYAEAFGNALLRTLEK